MLGTATTIVRRSAAHLEQISAAGLLSNNRSNRCWFSAAFDGGAKPSTCRKFSSSGTNRGYNIDLTGKVAFVAGVADPNGYGWAIAKQFANAGATIIVATWPPVLSAFEKGLSQGFGEDSKLIDGSDMKISKVYPLDARFSNPSEIPEDIKTHKRYVGLTGYDIQSCAEAVRRDFGKVDILVHSMANGPDVSKPLLETSRQGYLAASSATAYSLVSMLQHFGPMMPCGSSALSISFIGSERVFLGYGGGLSSAKAQLESDTKVLSWEAGRKYGIRVNTISAGPLASRAAIAIKKPAPGERPYIEHLIDYYKANAPIPVALRADDVGRAALGLCSELAGAVTGTCQYVDNGMHAVGLAVDSASFKSYIDQQTGEPWTLCKSRAPAAGSNTSSPKN